MIVKKYFENETMKTKPRLEWKDASMKSAFHVNETPYIHTPPVFKIKGQRRNMMGLPSKKLPAEMYKSGGRERLLSKNVGELFSRGDRNNINDARFKMLSESMIFHSNAL